MNESESWPLSLRLLHWVSAVLVMLGLVLGTYMVQFVDDPGERFDLTQTHKSIGVAVLALTAARLCLRMFTTAPKPELFAPSLVIAAKVAHVSLYALLLVLPLSGWLMATTTPIRVPTTVFGLFDLPYFLAPDLAAYGVAHAVHVVAAIGLAVLIVGHVTAALVHALCWGDRTLVRMWRRDSRAPTGAPEQAR
jgi:cytochrome b561